jgi:D-serine deaminase-like pyridoxal phosphate-dependent protein
VAFAEDLTEFFDSDEFAVAATIKRADDTTLRTANVFIDEPSSDEQVFGTGRVTASTPTATGRTADLGDVERDYKLVTTNATFVVVAAPKPIDDGALTIVKLRKA